MCTLKKSFLSAKCLVDYTLPRLHKGKQWYVDFYAYDPAVGDLRRKKYMLDSYKKLNEKENYAAILIHNIFERLKHGWNPWTDATRTRHFTEFAVVLDRYRAYIYHAAQKGALKEKTHIDDSVPFSLLRARFLPLIQEETKRMLHGGKHALG